MFKCKQKDIESRGKCGRYAEQSEVRNDPEVNNISREVMVNIFNKIKIRTPKFVIWVQKLYTGVGDRDLSLLF